MAEATYVQMRTSSPASQLADFDASLSATRSALGEDIFARAFAEGQVMTLEQAVEYALKD